MIASTFPLVNVPDHGIYSREADGGIISIVNGAIANRSLSTKAKLVTLIIQLSCNHVESVSKTIVLSPEIAHVVTEEQSHE